MINNKIYICKSISLFMKLMSYTTENPVMGIIVPQEIHWKLKILAAEMRTSMLNLAGSIINDYTKEIDFTEMEQEYLKKRQDDLDEKIRKLKRKDLFRKERTLLFPHKS